MKNIKQSVWSLSRSSSSLANDVVPTLRNEKSFSTTYDAQFLYQIMIDTALRAAKSLQALTYHDFFAFVDHVDVIKFFQEQGESFYDACKKQAQFEVVQKIHDGQQLLQGQRIVHTAPHHDDILLGYHAYAAKQLATNQNFMLYMTNGSRGIADDYVTELIATILQYDAQWFAYVCVYRYQTCIELFAQAFDKKDESAMQSARHFIFCNIVSELFDVTQSHDLVEQLKILHNYVNDQNNYDFVCDVIEKYKLVKERLRQSESDCKWMVVQGHYENVYHLGAEFYDNLSDTAVDRDVQRVVKFFEKTKPDIVTVALDPCGVGPATHFISLQVIARALKIYADTYDCHDHMTVIGYRNVWSQFSLSQADLIVPVTSQDLDGIEQIFQYCFATQTNPLHPCSLYEGPFSLFMRQIHEHQMQDLTMLIGHVKTPAISCEMTGAIFLKKFSLQELCDF